MIILPLHYNIKSTLLGIVCFSLFIFFANPYGNTQTMIATGRHSLAICTDSSIRSFGYNGFGQLGNGNINPELSGYPIPGMTEIVYVGGGLVNSYFVKKDGTVWACGRNSSGSIGDGSTINRLRPVQIPGLQNIVAATGGNDFSFYLSATGQVYACGINANGQLGKGTNTLFDSTLAMLTTISNVKQISCGGEHTLFLKNDSTVWACGYNGGRYGNGKTTHSNIPIQVPGLSSIVQVSAGEWYSLFLKSDGTVWVTGENNFGQLGDSTTKNLTTSKRIYSISDVVKIDAGGLHSVFIKSDGSVWACGINSASFAGDNSGQLGDGTTIDRHYPVPVIPAWGANKKVVDAYACREHSLFLIEDGTIWGAGRNIYGQLGNGKISNTNFSTPIQASPLCDVLLPKGPVSDLKNFKHISSIQVFPNPSGGILFIQTDADCNENIQLSIWDEMGKSLLERYVPCNHPQRYAIDLEFLPNGVYWIRARSRSPTIVQKLIISK